MVDVSKLARTRWHGQWIWARDAISKRKIQVHRRSGHKQDVVEEEKNVYCLVRHVFEKPGDLERAVINITADSRYKLFVNGKYVGRGINRCEAYYWYYNTFDITSYLQEGRNVIAIHARFYGQDFAFYTSPGGRGSNLENSGKGGVLFDVHLTVQSGENTWIGSGAGTRITINKGERSDVPLKNDALGFIEECDSRLIPSNWNEVDFDDTDWTEPMILDYPIKTLLIDENAPLHEEICYPSEILVIGENDDVNYDMDEDEKEEHLDFCIQHMLEGPIGELDTFSVAGKDNLLTGGGIVEVIPGNDSGGKVFSLFIKFPHEMVGYPRIIVEGTEGTTVDIIPSEKMSGNLPAMDWMGNKRGSRFILRGGKQFFEQWDWEGYLYMLVKIRNVSGPLKIHQLVTNRTHMRVRSRGYFKCSDGDLNKLWDACGLTLLCCAIDGYLDCPSREQRAYLGDAYPEALIANACFGEPRLTKKLIYDTAFGQRQDGMTYSFHPGDAVPQTHIIPDYCLYWMQITRDYYMFYGDEQVLVDMYPHFLLAIQWFWKYLDEDTGLLSDLPYWTFIDWSFSREKPGKWAILNAQFMDVLLFISEMAARFGDAQNEKKFKDKADQLRVKIDEVFWDEGEGCYRDFFHDGKLHQKSYMTNAYLVLNDITTDKKKVDSILSRIFEYPGSDEVVRSQIDDYYQKKMSHHAFGDKLKEMVVVAQPFFQHQVNKFFSNVGRYDLLLKYIYKWMPMLDIGKTGTIWETWSIDGSECHAWAATPAYDLSTYWLGVKPASPGFQSIEISPTFLGLDSVEGMYPTCRGDVRVSWKKEGRKVTVSINIPVKIEEGIFIIPPCDGKQPSAVDTSNSKLGENRYAMKPGSNEFTINY
ncbi:MAG: alpha-L-rhamnosidase-related protein [Promethearchaeota archaeon]